MGIEPMYRALQARFKKGVIPGQGLLSEHHGGFVGVVGGRLVGPQRLSANVGERSPRSRCASIGDIVLGQPLIRREWLSARLLASPCASCIPSILFVCAPLTTRRWT